MNLMRGDTLLRIFQYATALL